MADFPTLLARQQAAIFRRLGEDADWDFGDAQAPTPCRIILRDFDEESRTGLGGVVRRHHFIRVRSSEIESPQDRNIATLEDGSRYQIVGEPLMTRKGGWECSAKMLDPA